MIATHDPKEAWPAVRGLMNVKEDVVGNYPTFVKRIGEVIEHGYWREFYFEPLGKTKTFDTLENFLEWVRIDNRELIALLSVHGEETLLAKVRAELGGDLAEHGANQHGGVCDTKSTEQTDATYILARLRRDEPELAEKVLDGELSANAAAVAAGIRKRYVRIPAGDIDAAARKLREEFDLERLIDALRRVA